MKLGTPGERMLAAHIRTEILNYLQSCPDQVRAGSMSTAELSLRVGKLLIWLAGSLDQGEPPIRCPLGTPALSAFALGEQFRTAGLELWDAKQADNSTLAQLRVALTTALARVDELERSHHAHH